VVLNAPETRRVLDLDQPVAVLAIATLQHISDADCPIDMMAGYLDALPSGSYLAVSHLGPDEQLMEGYKLFDGMRLGERPEVHLRDQFSITRLFDGLEVVPPGIVPMVLWKPDSDEDIGRNPEQLSVYAGLGRKP
jgi:hypothetical protein